MINEYLKDKLNASLDNLVKNSVEYIKKSVAKNVLQGKITVSSSPYNTADVTVDLTKYIDLKTLNNLLVLQTKILCPNIDLVEKYSKDFNIICWDSKMGFRFYSPFLGILTKTGKLFISKITKSAEECGITLKIRKKDMCAFVVEYFLQKAEFKEICEKSVEKSSKFAEAQCECKRVLSEYGIVEENCDVNGNMVFGFGEKYISNLKRKISYNISMEISNGGVKINLGLELGTALAGQIKTIDSLMDNFNKSEKEKVGLCAEAIWCDTDVLIIMEVSSEIVNKIEESLSLVMSKMEEIVDLGSIEKFMQLTYKKD